jgi:long-chain acyl-CoA synthetase
MSNKVKAMATKVKTMVSGNKFPNAISGPAFTIPQIKLQNLLKVGLATKPDEVALHFAGENWTYRELDTASTNVAAAYLRLGAKAGDRVASLLPNSPDLLAHYIGCFKAGLVVTPLNNRYTAPEIDHAIKLSGASLLVMHIDNEKHLDQLQEKPSLGFVSLGGNGGSGRYLADFADLKKEEPKEALGDAPADDAPAIVFFTSGSTGKP